MRLADSVRKRRPEAGSSYGAEGGPYFCPLVDGVRDFFARTAGRLLLVADGENVSRLAPFFSHARAMSIVLEGADALPLFATPEEIGGVVGIGGREIMEAVRLFAGVRGIGCLLLPVDCGLRGVFCRTGGQVAGESLALPEAEVCLDEALLAPTAAEGFARAALFRLAFFEAKEKSVFFGTPPPSEEVYMRLKGALEADLSALLLMNAFAERTGQGGEGEILAKTCGSFAAYEGLLRLYTAFFRCGVPRKYVVPDYAARAAEAGGTAALPPTEEEYARRAILLERRRAGALREIGLLGGLSACRSRYVSLGGRPKRADMREIRRLPERSGGLSVLIRDFGLLEDI